MSLRDKFKATAMSDLDNQQKEFDSVFDGGGEYLSIEIGKNKIRIFPKHPEHKTFIVPKVVHFLPIQVTDEEGKKTIKQKPVWSGVFHSPEKSCIIDEYFSQVFALAKQFTDKKQRTAFTSRVTAFKGGISSSKTWVVYANLIKGTTKKFGILELKTSVKNGMNSLAANLDDGASMITTDPYTDPDSGRCIFVTYDNKADKAEDYYKVGIDIMGSTPLSDAELEALVAAKPLSDMYVDCYKRSDFILALEGLKRFDEEADDYNIFSSEHWATIVERFSDLYPEESTEEQAEQKAPEKIATVEKKAPEKIAATSSKPKTIDEMTKPELESYIKTNKLTIRTLPTDTSQEIVGLIKREESLNETLKASAETKEEALPENPLQFLKSQI